MHRCGFGITYGVPGIRHDHDSAKSGDIGDNQETWFQTTVTGPGELRFAYKLSCDSGDEYALFIDEQYISGRAGSKDWTESSPHQIYGAGTHTIRWKFMKDSSGSEGSDCLWIDHVRWTGAMPDMGAFNEITYVYDAEGRRIEKKYDGTTQVKFVYDGSQCVAEYNAAGSLLRKYIYGPGIDEPICMIEASGSYTGTYYYHYDALGSVVGLTNSSGSMVELYEYSVYGQVAASDPNHPNRFMFTGREFDKDTGLYYYRARYYHPEVGRFLQTDPVGYEAGMNLYRYCSNDPVNATDALGLDEEEQRSASHESSPGCPPARHVTKTVHVKWELDSAPAWAGWNEIELTLAADWWYEMVDGNCLSKEDVDASAVCKKRIASVMSPCLVVGPVRSVGADGLVRYTASTGASWSAPGRFWWVPLVGQVMPRHEMSTTIDITVRSDGQAFAKVSNTCNRWYRSGQNWSGWTVEVDGVPQDPPED